MLLACINSTFWEFGVQDMAQYHNHRDRPKKHVYLRSELFHLYFSTVSPFLHFCWWYNKLSIQLRKLLDLSSKWSRFSSQCITSFIDPYAVSASARSIDGCLNLRKFFLLRGFSLFRFQLQIESTEKRVGRITSHVNKLGFH